MRHDALTPAEAFFRPPPRVSGHVLDFCLRVSPDHSPVYVDARRVPGTRAGMCFHNVREQCAQHGGAAEYGWLIWEWEDTYIEAEHHAVWRHGGGRVEVTPRHPHQDRVLFLPDPGRAFDFDRRARFDNVRMPLRSDANVREYLTLAARGVAIEEANSAGGDVVLAHEVTCELEKIWLRMRLLEAEFVEWSLRRHGRNEPCWCGSGRKLKKCCTSAGRKPALALQTA